MNQKLDQAQTALDEHHDQIETIRQRCKEKSNQLQQNLFNRYQLLKVSLHTQTPLEIFKSTPLQIPPSGTGDCAAIKLFQHAFSRGYYPVALAEFWWGPSPHVTATNVGDVARTHVNYYPCCRGKCEPILNRHMLLGLNVDSDPLTEGINNNNNKPHNVLSVPGQTVRDSTETDLRKCYPNATGPILVHRLDYSTSGLLLGAKDSNTHKELQAQFIVRMVTKRYTALLEGLLSKLDDLNNNKSSHINCANHDDDDATIIQQNKRGRIDLPLAGDYLNRPMQKAEWGPEGKPALTFYEIIDKPPEGKFQTTTTTTTTAAAHNQHQTPTKTRTRVHFYPRTDRTHQLWIHASHPEGLGMAIVEDDIYGRRDKRLYLHVGLLAIDHPRTQERLTFKAPVPF